MSADTGNCQKAGLASPLGEGGEGGRAGEDRNHSPESGKEKWGGRSHLPGSKHRQGAGQGRSPQPQRVPPIQVTQPGLGWVTLLSLVKCSGPRGAAEAASPDSEPRTPGPPSCSPHGCREGLDSPGEARTFPLRLSNGLPLWLQKTFFSVKPTGPWGGFSPGSGRGGCEEGTFGQCGLPLFSWGALRRHPAAP